MCIRGVVFKPFVGRFPALPVHLFCSLSPFIGPPVCIYAEVTDVAPQLMDVALSDSCVFFAGWPPPRAVTRWHGPFQFAIQYIGAKKGQQVADA